MDVSFRVEETSSNNKTLNASLHKFVTGATLLQLEETGVPGENHRSAASH